MLVLPGQAERSGTASIAMMHRDDYRALFGALQEADLPDGIGVWVTYSPDPKHPELACIGIALLNEDDAFRILKALQQRLDLQEACSPPTRARKARDGGEQGMRAKLACLRRSRPR